MSLVIAIVWVSLVFLAIYKYGCYMTDRQRRRDRIERLRKLPDTIDQIHRLAVDRIKRGGRA